MLFFLLINVKIPMIVGISCSAELSTKMFDNLGTSHLIMTLLFDSWSSDI